MPLPTEDAHFIMQMFLAHLLCAMPESLRPEGASPPPRARPQTCAVHCLLPTLNQYDWDWIASANQSLISLRRKGDRQQALTFLAQRLERMFLKHEHKRDNMELEGAVHDMARHNFNNFIIELIECFPRIHHPRSAIKDALGKTQVVNIAFIKGDVLHSAYLGAVQNFLGPQVVGLIVVDPPTGESNHHWDKKAMTPELIISMLARVLQTSMRADRCSVAVFAVQSTLSDVVSIFQRLHIGGMQIITVAKDVPAPVTKGMQPSTFVEYLVVGVQVQGTRYPDMYSPPVRGPPRPPKEFPWPGFAPREEDMLMGMRLDRCFPPPSVSSRHFRPELDAYITPPGTLATVNTTQKGYELCRWLVRKFCPEGTAVLSLCSGVASVEVAAAKEGFNVVGVDNDEVQIAHATRRLVMLKDAEHDLKPKIERLKAAVIQELELEASLQVESIQERAQELQLGAQPAVAIVELTSQAVEDVVKGILNEKQYRLLAEFYADTWKLFKQLTVLQGHDALTSIKAKNRDILFGMLSGLDTDALKGEIEKEVKRKALRAGVVAERVFEDLRALDVVFGEPAGVSRELVPELYREAVIQALAAPSEEAPEASAVPSQEEQAGGGPSAEAGARMGAEAGEQAVARGMASPSGSVEQPGQEQQHVLVAEAGEAGEAGEVGEQAVARERASQSGSAVHPGQVQQPTVVAVAEAPIEHAEGQASRTQG